MDRGEMRSTSGSAPHERFEIWFEIAASKRWRWQMAEGLNLILLGVVALATATAASSFVTGAILLGAGAATLLSIWRAEQSQAFGLSLLLALVAFGSGFLLLRQPPETMLGLIFAAYFVLRGVVTILLAAAYRRQRLNQWEWFAVSGVTGLIIAGLILSGLPGPYIWMLGLLLGVDLIFDGSAVLAMALTSDRLSDTAPAPVVSRALGATLPGGPVCEDGVHV